MTHIPTHTYVYIGGTGEGGWMDGWMDTDTRMFWTSKAMYV